MSAKQKKLKLQRDRYDYHRRKLIKLFGGVCAECGTEHRLEFHHRDPADKNANVSRLFGRRGLVAILSEAIKCDLLCTDCHLDTPSFGRRV